METDAQIENGVLIGTNDELYLAGGNHSVLLLARGERRISDQSVQNFWQNAEERQAFAAARDIAFLTLIAPEKYRVVPDGFPIASARSPFDDYNLRSADYMLYPVEDLIKNEFGVSYYKTDTHWSLSGIRKIAQLIGRRAGLSEEQLRAADDLVAPNIRPFEFCGDLGRKLAPERKEPAERVTRMGSVRAVENGMTHDYTRPVNDGRMICSHSPDAVSPKTLLIFGDSYLHNSLPVLEAYFQNVIFCRTRFFHNEMVEMVAPDIIVCQQAERYLGAVAPDREAPPFLLLPFVLGRSMSFAPDDARFVSNMLSCGRKPNFALFPAP